MGDQVFEWSGNNYQIFQIHGAVTSLQRLVVGDPEDGWIEKDRFGLAQALCRTRIISQNNPDTTYEIRDTQDGSVVARYMNGVRFDAN